MLSFLSLDIVLNARTVTRILDPIAINSRLSVSAITVTPCFVAEYIPAPKIGVTICPARLESNFLLLNMLEHKYIILLVNYTLILYSSS